MPISSIIVRTKDAKTDAVAARIRSMKEASVSAIHHGDIIVITDTDRQNRDREIWEEIEGIDGVVQCDLVYHNFEDEEGYHYD